MTLPFYIALQLALVLAFASAPALAFSGPIFHSVPAVTTADQAGHGAMLLPGTPDTKIAAATSPIPAKGVVLKVDRANATIKINHDPIPALDWPRMTMPFRLKERALADLVKEGDAVEFFLEKSGSDYVIVKFGKSISTRAVP
ncbi:MAG: copper-binding protein [Nitrosospira sp.]